MERCITGHSRWEIYCKWDYNIKGNKWNLNQYKEIRKEVKFGGISNLWISVIARSIRPRGHFVASTIKENQVNIIIDNKSVWYLRRWWPGWIWWLHKSMETWLCSHAQFFGKTDWNTKKEKKENGDKITQQERPAAVAHNTVNGRCLYSTVENKQLFFSSK